MTRRRPKDPPTDPAIVATRLVRADTRSLSVPGVVVADELVELTDELDTEVLADEGERNRPPAASRGEEGLVLHRALEELPQAWHVPGVATRGADDLTGDICHAYGAGDACRKHW